MKLLKLCQNKQIVDYCFVKGENKISFYLLIKQN